MQKTGMDQNVPQMGNMMNQVGQTSQAQTDTNIHNLQFMQKLQQNNYGNMNQQQYQGQQNPMITLNDNNIPKLDQNQPQPNRDQANYNLDQNQGGGFHNQQVPANLLREKLNQINNEQQKESQVTGMQNDQQRAQNDKGPNNIQLGQMMNMNVPKQGGDMNQGHQNPETDKVQNLNQPDIQPNAAPQIENNKLEGNQFDAANN